MYEAGQVGYYVAWRAHNGAGLCPGLHPFGTAVRIVLPDGGGELTGDLTTEPGFKGILACDGTVEIWDYGS